VARLYRYLRKNLTAPRYDTFPIWGFTPSGVSLSPSSSHAFYLSTHPITLLLRIHSCSEIPARYPNGGSATLVLTFFLPGKAFCGTGLGCSSGNLESHSIFLLTASLFAYWYFTAATKKKALLIISLALAATPMALWLFFLRFSSIDNPFFGDHFTLSRHTGGSDFALILSRAYWKRFFTWVVSRGVSVPIFLFFILGLLKLRTKILSEKILYLSAMAVVPYWILVRGPQFSATWYSFPFLVPMLVIGSIEILRVRTP
jgi:hypothetical protein